MLMQLGAILLITGLQGSPPVGGETPRPEPPPPAETAEPDADSPPRTAEDRLREEIEALLAELQQLRTEAAKAKLEAAEATRELEELRQFIIDHDRYGDAFEEYREIKAIKEREQRMKELEEARRRAEQARQERLERLRAARERRAAERGEARESEKYLRAGFEPIGLDVYIGRMAYAYAVRDVTDVDVSYDPVFGFYRRDDVRNEIDYTRMTISGSVVNGGNEVRNIGVAVAFFDGNGNQVGHETVQINNARPDVPYPFTSSMTMALNDRPFSSSTAYVLYADSVAPAPSGD